MDFPSAVRSDALRPIATIVLPGAIAVAPYIVVVGYYQFSVRRFWTEHPTAFGIVMTLIVILAGLILEEVGSLIELRWDALLQKRDKSLGVVWRSYLQLHIKDEVIGQRYLRDILTRYKFELAMPASLLLMLAGLLWIDWIYDIASRSSMAVTSVVVLIIAGFLLWESFQSAELLGRLRRAILDSVRLNAAGEHFLT